MTSENDNQPEMKIITINIETPDGKLPTAKVRIPNIPMRLADLVPPMQQLCNGIVELANKREIASGSAISCKKGCGVCCCQLVPLSAPEAFFLYGYIKSLPEEKRKVIEEKISEIRKAMDFAGIIERLHNIEDTNEHKVLAWDYFNLGISCLFL
ncbi:MAG: hypothetical protein AAB116_13675, partial [Candidatus Poribacteria bacterium]